MVITLIIIGIVIYTLSTLGAVDPASKHVVVVADSPLAVNTPPAIDAPITISPLLTHPIYSDTPGEIDPEPFAPYVAPEPVYVAPVSTSPAVTKKMALIN